MLLLLFNSIYPVAPFVLGVILTPIHIAISFLSDTFSTNPSSHSINPLIQQQSEQPRTRTDTPPTMETEQTYGKDMVNKYNIIFLLRFIKFG